jgi:hypothetical protein
MFAQALAYAEHGVKVFPCVPGEKRPITPRGYLDATTDPYRIRTWWNAHPRANIASPTGAPGFDALDVDVRANGDGWHALRRLNEIGLLDGWVRAVSTPSGGMHFHYPGTEQRNASLRDIHLDFRGLGGYVLLPPSSITTADYSGTYKLLERRAGPGRPLDWAEVIRILAPRRNPVLRTPPRGLDTVAWLAAHVARQLEGNRDNALFWAACRAVEAGATDLERLVQAGVHTGLPERQARRTVRSAQDTIARGPAQAARSLPQPPAPDVPAAIRSA